MFRFCCVVQKSVTTAVTILLSRPCESVCEFGFVTSNTTPGHALSVVRGSVENLPAPASTSDDDDDDGDDDDDDKEEENAGASAATVPVLVNTSSISAEELAQPTAQGAEEEGKSRFASFGTKAAAPCGNVDDDDDVDTDEKGRDDADVEEIVPDVDDIDADDVAEDTTLSSSRRDTRVLYVGSGGGT